MADLWQEIQSVIYYGDAIAAEILSPPHAHYRPVGTGMALNSANRVLPDLPFLADKAPGDFKFKSPVGYGKPAWQALVDGSAVAVGDYLSGPSGDWFVAAKQPLHPIMVVKCNRVISLLRPSVADPSYLGDVQSEEVTLLSGWPCSLLQGTKGEASDTGVPTDTRVPWFAILLPPITSNLIIRHNDFLTDDLGRRYEIASVELTSLGWRLTASEKDV